jgi:quinol monooxygenase YgiN
MIMTSILYTFADDDAETVKALRRELRDASRKEPGVIRFDIGQSVDHPGVFALWEVYRDKEAAEAHAATEHFERLVLRGIRPLAQQRVAAEVVPI